MNKIISIVTVSFTVMVIGCGEKPQPKPEPPVKKEPQVVYKSNYVRPTYTTPKREKAVSLNPTVKETGSSGIPKWYLNPNTRIKVGFIGATATETSRDIQTAMDKAQSAARGQLRMQIQDIGESGSDRFVKETGINDNSKIIKSFEIANRSASAAVLRKTELEISDIQKDGALYRAYVLLIAPDPELESVNEMKKDQELYLEFQKTEYFKDLNERLEKFKKSQGG